MTEESVGLDVAGGGEIITALKAGADPTLIVLHGNAKTDAEIALAVEHGVGLVVVDNSDDVDRLETAVPPGRRQDVLVRVIPGVTADTHASVLTGHEGSKFGLAPAVAAELIKRIEHSPRLRMRGLHVHVGSQILDVAPFAASVAAIADMGEYDVYDLGGGLGARYTYDDHPPSVAGISTRWSAPPGRRSGTAIVNLAAAWSPAPASLLPRRHGQRDPYLRRVDGGMGDNGGGAVWSTLRAGLADRIDAPRGELVARGPTLRAETYWSRVPLQDRASTTWWLFRPLARIASPCPTTTTAIVRPSCSSRRIRSAVVRHETWEDLLRRDID
jgi:diaminopimelate decarboxylase